MKRIIISINLILCGFGSYGQTTFSKLYWNYPYTSLGLSVSVDANFIYQTGRGSSFIDGTLMPNFYFLKANLSGDQILIKSLVGDLSYIYNVGYASSSALVNDTTIYVAGYYSRYDTLFPPWNEEHNGMLYAFNLEGDTLFTKKHVGDGDTEFNRLIFDNNMLLLGGDTRDTIDTIATVVPSYLVKLDHLGQLIWETKLGDGIQIETTGLMDFSSSGQIIAGGSIINSVDMFGIYRNGKVYKIDASGVIYFTKEIGTPGADTEIEVKVSKNYQSYVVRQNLDTVINEGDYGYVQYIGKTDTNFNFLWRTFLNDEYYKYIYTLRTFEDGSIVAVGAAVVDDTYEPHGYIVKLDSNGTVLWERDYANAPGGHNYLYDFQKMPDGGYICSGLGGDSIDGGIESMAWLLRLDSMGCLIPGCDEVSVYDFIDDVDPSIKLYPNPFAEQATLEINVPDDFVIDPNQTLHCDIIDMQGRIVDTYSNIYLTNPGETIRFAVFRRGMATGTYLARISYGDMLLGTISISCVEHN